VEGVEHLSGVGQAAKPGETTAPGTDLDRPRVVPVVLPQAVVTVDDSTNARIVVENIDHHTPIDRPNGPVGRDELGAVLARIAEQVGGPVRVEVREPDGSRYADILQPRPQASKTDAAHETNEPDEGPLLRSEGFLPAETVLVAVVITTTEAQPDGTVSLASLRLPAGSGGEIILFGGASARVVQRQLPTDLEARKRRWWR
jgi:hypothetical protein